MKMKQLIIKFSTVFAFTALLVGCTKENTPQTGVHNGTEFTLHLVQTKTANDGYGTKWVQGDRVNVFHAEAGTRNYISDGPFEFTENNEFKGYVRDDAIVNGNNYDWYVLYPYDENMSSPEAAPIHIPADQYQSKNNDMSHLAGSYCPLAGKAESIPTSAAVVINMKHLVTVLKIKVTNYEPDPMSLDLVSFRADKATHENENVNIINGDSQTIAGSFEVDITGDKLTYNQVDKGKGRGTSRPLIHIDTPVTLNTNESATVYIVSIPFYIGNSCVYTIGMNNDVGGVSQALYGKNIAFKAGQICSIRQGSRLAPPFKDGINFYIGAKNSDGTYSYGNGWWRCDLPVEYQFSGEFSFADLFYSFNTGDAVVTMHSINNQNDRTGNNGTSEGEAKFNELASCCQGYRWVRNQRFTHNFNVNYSDKSGIFFRCSAGYNVGVWDIWFRSEDPFESLIKVVNNDWMMKTTPTIDGSDLWNNRFTAPNVVYGTISAGEEINICSFYNNNPASWHPEMYNLFYPNWKNFTIIADNGEKLIYNDGQNVVLTEYAKKFCRQSSGLIWLPAWYIGFDRISGEYREEAAWDNGAAAAKHGISITSDGRLVTAADYDGWGFRLAPSLYFEYDYGYAQHVGTKYLPFIVANI
jgi:hypothetical protein